MNDQEYTMRVDTRYARFNIHRKTLKAIGDPPFVNFGYNPQTKELMIFGSRVDDRSSVRVRFTRGGACFIFSRRLLTGIRKVSGVLTEDASYLVKGRLADSVKAVSFSLLDAELDTTELQTDDAGTGGGDE